MNGPRILTPGSAAEIVEIIKAAARDRASLFVTSGARAPALATLDARVVSMRGMNRLVAHEPGDLTLTAECGLTVKEAQDLLAPHGQFLAFDVEHPEEATIGGVIAAGRDGPLAARHGMVRDQVLGLTVLNGDGRLTHCGGRVVKNVTGYDLVRLYTGSRGGLGILIEATVRVRPLPQRARRYDLTTTTEAAAFERAFEIRRAVPEVTTVQVRRRDPAAPITVSAVVAGLDAFVDGAGNEVRAILARAGQPTVSDCDPRSARLAAEPSGFQAVEITAPTAAFPALAAEVAPLLQPAAAWVHDLLRGVYTSWHAGATPFRDEQRLDAVLAKRRAVLDCPDDPRFAASVASRFPSQVPDGLALMESLKAALDPLSLLNPGMTVYG